MLIYFGSGITMFQKVQCLLDAQYSTALHDWFGVLALNIGMGESDVSSLLVYTMEMIVYYMFV